MTRGLQPAASGADHGAADEGGEVFGVSAGNRVPGAVAERGEGTVDDPALGSTSAMVQYPVLAAALAAFGD
jgi:hypothetical protein